MRISMTDLLPHYVPLSVTPMAWTLSAGAGLFDLVKVTFPSEFMNLIIHWVNEITFLCRIKGGFVLGQCSREIPGIA